VDELSAVCTISEVLRAKPAFAGNSAGNALLTGLLLKKKP
jgi:hypothetical protein